MFDAEGNPETVFKTVAFVRSATLPAANLCVSRTRGIGGICQDTGRMYQGGNEGLGDPTGLIASTDALYRALVEQVPCVVYVGSGISPRASRCRQESDLRHPV